MILADKIITQRKKNGWSQEELAEKMNVSRQAVSKWEAAQTTPDLEKILRLGKLFGVTTDYLLKDEIETEMFTEAAEEESIRKITLAEANEYLAQRKDASLKIAIATFLCMVSVIPLLLLSAAAEYASLPITENTAVGIGVIALFPVVAGAVVIFMRVGFRNAPYAFLETESFNVEYGVVGFVRDRQKAYRSTYGKYNCVGVSCCVLAPIPLLCGSFSENELLLVILLCVALLTAGMGVMFLVIAGVQWESMKKLLQEGDYSEKGKRRNKITEAVGTVFWLLAVAVYLGWSFLTNDWHITWLVWPVAAVLFGCVHTVCGLLADRKE